MQKVATSAWGRHAHALGLGLVWLGLALLGASAGLAADSWAFAHARVHALAVVTENVAGFSPGGGVVYRARLRLRAPDGTWVQVLDPAAREDPEFAVGTRVPVLYPRGEPAQAQVATRWRLYPAAIWLALWGVVAFDIGWVIRRLS